MYQDTTEDRAAFHWRIYQLSQQYVRRTMQPHQHACAIYETCATCHRSFRIVYWLDAYCDNCWLEVRDEVIANFDYGF